MDDLGSSQGGLKFLESLCVCGLKFLEIHTHIYILRVWFKFFRDTHTYFQSVSFKDFRDTHIHTHIFSVCVKN